MLSRLDRALLLVVAVVWLTVGLWGLAAPAGMLALVGVDAPSAEGRIELRAMYGGLSLGMASFTAWCLHPDRQRVGLVAGALTLGGHGGARALSLLLDEAVPFGLLHVFAVAELCGAGLWTPARFP